MGCRRVWLVLVLVAGSALVVVNPLNTQDVSRLSLSRSLAERGSVDIDPYRQLTLDRSFRNGHWYSDKAPGVSVLAIPTLEALRAADALGHDRQPIPVWRRETHIWALRFLTGGVALLASTLLVAAAAEAVRPGYWMPVAVTFALGTIAGPLGITTFGHDPAGALGLAALLSAACGRRKLLPLAGLLAGLAVCFEYQAALIVAVVAVYAVLRYRLRGLLAYLVGGIAPVIALGLYNRAAFGSPFHLSYRYVANEYSERQHQGLFGIGAPTAQGAWSLFLDGKGLLVVSPVLVAAAAGLVLLWRRGFRLEAGALAAVTVLFLFADMGYFDPYGGASPGPRFFAPALPFLAIGLAEAFHRWPLPTAALALYSIAMTTFDAITWAIANTLRLDVDPTTLWTRGHLLSTHTGMLLVFTTTAATTAYAGAQLARTRRDDRADNPALSR